MKKEVFLKTDSPNGENLFIGNGVPSIQLLIGMRHMGYDNIQTLGDLIDNSIDAIVKDGNGFIKILSNFDANGNSSIVIIDNGCGMDVQTLSKALIFGGDKERDEDDLGKFVMGMKSASLAMGKRLKIVTKAENSDYLTGIFDYDEAIQKKQWDFITIVKSSKDEISYFKENVGGESTGTVVQVSKLDRLDYNSSEKNKKHLDDKLRKHISEIFRHFISTSKDDDRIDFYYNDTKLMPIDPMCRDMEKSHEFKIFNPNDGDYEVVVNDKKYNFKVICYHVPHIDIGSREAMFNMRHTSPMNSGFYLMRNNRQIQRATWDMFKTKTDEDTKVRHQTGNQFRAELFFNSDCDDIFKTDVTKRRIVLPQEVIDKINTEVWTYLRGVQKIHSRGYNNKSKDEIKKDLVHIARKMNKKVNTPTVTRNKDDVEIKPTVLPVTPKNTGTEKKEHSRGKNKKIEFGLFAGESRGSFITVNKEGLKKYVIKFNTNHAFYDKFDELDRNAKEVAVYLLHSVALTLYSELYDTYLDGEGKTLLIEEFLDKMSDYLRKDFTE